jgi:hypothetical protein
VGRRDRSRAVLTRSCSSCSAAVVAPSRAGPPPLLRLLRGDADPALRPGRRLGGNATGRNRDVRHLHDGRVAG